MYSTIFVQEGEAGDFYENDPESYRYDLIMIELEQVDAKYIDMHGEPEIESVSWKIEISEILKGNVSSSVNYMKRKDLMGVTGISSASVAKLGRGNNFQTDILLRICETLDCTIEDILETIRE